MSKNNKIALAMIVMLGLTASAKAYTISWCSSSGDWGDSARWDVMPSPVLDGQAIIFNGAVLNVTTAGHGAWHCEIGYEPGGSTVNVAAGIEWKITDILRVGDGNTGVLNIYGTASCERLIIGNTAASSGTINVYDSGTLNVGSCNMGEGTARINLIGGGCMTVGGGDMTVHGPTDVNMTSLGHIDIADGYLKVAGDYRTQLSAYISQNRITAYNGTGTVNVPFYDSKTGFTTVTAFPRFYAFASQSIPLNGATWMPLNTTLSWTAGLGAKSHNVYFGTTSPGTFQRNQTETTFNPGTLEAGTTYYWRVDEVDGPNIFTGTVRSFTTKVKVEMKLNRGIVIDRQFSSIPPSLITTIVSKDIQIIKSMGFDFVKVLVNPACFISGSTINLSNMWYVDELVNRVLAEGLPVVVCVHPQPEFKTTYIGTPGGFTNVLGFYKDFAAYMADRWDPNELAFELMTEPWGNYTDWNIMLPQMWQAARSGMPKNTLILDALCAVKADGTGTVDRLIQLNPMADDNVYYSFTTYAPFAFTFQGWEVTGYYYPWLNNVPYPSSASNNPAQYILPDCPPSVYSDANIAVDAYCNTPWDMNQQRAMLKPITDWNNAHGGKLKIMCAEWGSLDRQRAQAGAGCNPSDRIQFIHDRRQALEEINIGWAYWSYNESFTVFEPTLRTIYSKSPSYDWVDKNMLNALGLLNGQDDIKVDSNDK